MTVLELLDVCYTYDKGTPMAHEALSGINLKIEKGIMTGIIGHTGCGKSTMLRMFNGLLKPDSGKILLNGEDIWENPKDITKVRFHVGLVMQYPEYQLFDETVRADIAYGPKNMGLDDAEVNRRVLEAAAFTGVTEEMLDKSPFELSGGQKRRVAIAGIMAMKPEVLVLDEPAAGLDPKGREDIFLGLERYCRESGASVIIVSHSMEDMARYCERLVVMNDGRIYAEGTQKEVFSDSERLMQIGLGVPEVTKLIAILRDGGMILPSDIYTVDAAKEALASLFGGECK